MEPPPFGNPKGGDANHTPKKTFLHLVKSLRAVLSFDRNARSKRAVRIERLRAEMSPDPHLPALGVFHYHIYLPADFTRIHPKDRDASGLCKVEAGPCFQDIGVSENSGVVRIPVPDSDGVAGFRNIRLVLLQWDQEPKTVSGVRPRMDKVQLEYPVLQ